MSILHETRNRYLEMSMSISSMLGGSQESSSSRPQSSSGKPASSSSQILEGSSAAPTSNALPSIQIPLSSEESQSHSRNSSVISHTALPSITSPQHIALPPLISSQLPRPSIFNNTPSKDEPSVFRNNPLPAQPYALPPIQQQPLKPLDQPSSKAEDGISRLKKTSQPLQQQQHPTTTQQPSQQQQHSQTHSSPQAQQVEGSMTSVEERRHRHHHHHHHHHHFHHHIMNDNFSEPYPNQNDVNYQGQQQQQQILQPGVPNLSSSPRPLTSFSNSSPHEDSQFGSAVSQFKSPFNSNTTSNSNSAIKGYQGLTAQAGSIIVSSSDVYNSIAHFPRYLLGSILYEYKYGDETLLPRYSGKENCLVQVRIPRRYLSRYANPNVVERRLWGTDIYTDDSDIVSILYHTGILPPKSNLNGDFKKKLEEKQHAIEREVSDRKKAEKRQNEHEKDTKEPASKNADSKKEGTKEDEKVDEFKSKSPSSNEAQEPKKSFENPDTVKANRNSSHDSSKKSLPPSRAESVPVSGWSEEDIRIQNEIDGDCLATLIILPRLEKYVGCYRNGINSRTWDRVPHDGVSIQVVGVEFIPRGRAEMFNLFATKQKRLRNWELEHTKVFKRSFVNEDERYPYLRLKVVSSK